MEIQRQHRLPHFAHQLGGILHPLGAANNDCSVSLLKLLTPNRSAGPVPSRYGLILRVPCYAPQQLQLLFRQRRLVVRSPHRTQQDPSRLENGLEFHGCFDCVPVEGMVEFGSPLLTNTTNPPPFRSMPSANPATKRFTSATS